MPGEPTDFPLDPARDAAPPESPGPESRVRAAIARHLPDREIRSLTVLGEGLDNRAYEVDGDLIIRIIKNHGTPAPRPKAHPSAAGSELKGALTGDHEGEHQGELKGEQGTERAVEHGDGLEGEHGDGLDSGALRREAELLAALSGFSPLPVPEPVFVDGEAGVLAYRKLPGVPLLGHPVKDPLLLAPALGRFLSALHQADGMERLVPRDVEPLAVWLADAEETYAQPFQMKKRSPPARGRTATPIVNPDTPPAKANDVLWTTLASQLPAEYRPRIESFLAAPPPDEPQEHVFSHNDLGAEHILVDVGTSTITGIIDWTDAAITDPMHDLALLYRDLGPEVFEAVLRHYEGPCDRERVLFYARCSVLEDIAYGLATGSYLYADAGIAHLPWIFGPSVAPHPT
ncbi:hypothetical protein Acsp03_41940 [Actinomadura sp. NBRC 104412]|uniref:phosphotransferase n=1 Tax=Actinomadura sp. NBRC 104412 TaxID=3032203 RepID=UPI0024A0BC95|nr:phosphotransferase [Actinomadura sp. NBRC 104412]GLZ06728.1 hypothetical protein Acsp03_41940 [Actinomadura sp. NBRC 104412]